MTLRRIAIVFGLISLTSCSASWHLEKACDKMPEICTPDPVSFVDTVFVPGESIRDTFVFDRVDTIEIERERLRVKILRSYDTIQVDAECLSDTIVRTITLPVPKPVEVVRGVSKWWKYSWVIVGGLFIVMMLMSLVRAFR